MAARQSFQAWLAAHLPGAEGRFGARYLGAQVFPAEEQARLAAWEVHVELRMRIATQELPLHSGQERAALTSLHQLFDRTRATLQKHGPKVDAVGAVIMAALNEDLRPLTAYWHGVMGDSGLEQPDECGDFRADLSAVQNRLRVLADFLGYVARGEGYHADRLNLHPLSVPSSAPVLRATTTVPFLGPEIAKAERESIRNRRSCMLSEAVESRRYAGLALSGGGIRSATFSLGVLTALSRAGLYRYFDYLSTVSGGGYTGTLLSTWATAKARELQADEKDPSTLSNAGRRSLCEGPFSDDAAVEHLRDRSRYLIDGGPAGIARAIVPLMLGVLASVAMLVLTTLPTFWLARWVAQGGHWLAQKEHQTAVRVAVGSAIAVLLLIMRFRRSRDWAGRAIAMALVGVTALAAPAASVYAVVAVHDQIESLLLLISRRVSAEVVLGALPFAMTWLGSLLKRRVATLRAARALLALSPWVAYALALTLLAHALAPLSDGPLHEHVLLRALNPGALHTWYLALLIATIVILCSDVNESSPHGYYRDRLAETYCVTTEGERIKASPRPTELHLLTDLAPIHLINATVNLPATTARNDRGRAAAPFVFSKHGFTYPAGTRDGLKPRFAAYEPFWMRRFDVATAMAISGAAVSPWMGTSTPDGASPWMTLFNLRLSYWLRNPARPHAALASIPWGFYLLRELVGRVHERGLRINVSDGGHFENLGVYELIRRRCRYIVAIDGEADPELRCGGLMNLIRLARVDFGADIRIDTRKLRLDADRFSRAHLAIGRIVYATPTTPGDTAEGTLLYVKLSVTGDEPGPLLTYRGSEPSFPHQGTGDQIFSEEQFEAYRALGQHIGEKLFRVELIGDLASQAAQHAASPEKDGVALSAWINAIHTALARDLPPTAAQLIAQPSPS